MRTWQKVALTVIGSLAAFAVIAAIAIFAVLPDPATLGARLRKTAQSEAERRAQFDVRDEALETPPAAVAQNLGGATNPARPATTMDAGERRQQVTEKFVDRYLSEDRMQSRVCENLSSRVAPFKNVAEFGQQIESSLLGETPRSPTAEAVMLPVEYTLKNDAVRELVFLARDAAMRGDTGFLRKAEFYAQAARATASVLSSREELEAVSGHAYRLYALSRAVALKPEVLQDADATGFCRDAEQAALDGVLSDDADARERLDRILSRHGIDPTSIGYDSRRATDVRIVTTDAGVQVRIPWLDLVLQR